MKKIHILRLWLFSGIALELLIVSWCYFSFNQPSEVFRYAARYSGRLSFIAYVVYFLLFALAAKHTTKERWKALRNALLIFSILHVIHFGFLALNVHLNAIPLETYKVIAGSLTYGIIVVTPWLPRSLLAKQWFNFIYFYWVGLVMALTFLARIKGEFEGAEPAVFHYIGLVCIVLLFIGIPFYTRQFRTSTPDQDTISTA